jgi:hypothetical protein
MIAGESDNDKSTKHFTKNKGNLFLLTVQVRS